MVSQHESNSQFFNSSSSNVPPSPGPKPPAFVRFKQSIRAAATRTTKPPSAFKHPQDPSSPIPQLHRSSDDSKRSSLDSANDLIVDTRSNSRLGFAARVFRRNSADLKERLERDRARQLEKEERVQKERAERAERDRLRREERETKVEQHRLERERERQAREEKKAAKRASTKLSLSTSLANDSESNFLWRPFQAPTLSKGSMSSPTLPLPTASEDSTSKLSGHPAISSPKIRRPSQPSPASASASRQATSSPPRPGRIGSSASASHLPLASSSSLLPRATSPSDSRTPRPPPTPTRSPTADGFTRHPNFSTPSLPHSPSSPRSPSRRVTSPSPTPLSPPLSPSRVTSSPELREAIRTASRHLISHVGKPQPHLPVQSTRDWDEIETRLRGLVRLESRVWSKNEASSPSSDDRERRYFVEALKDGYLISLLLNMLLPPQVPQLKPSRSPTSATNIPRFLTCLRAHMQHDDVHIPAFLPDDLTSGSHEGLERVAHCIIAMGRRREEHRRGAVYMYDAKGSISTPNLHRSVSPAPALLPKNNLKRMSPPVQPARKEEERSSEVMINNKDLSKQPSVSTQTPLAGDRTSVTTTGTNTTYLSSLFTIQTDDKRFGTVKTTTTEATSIALEETFGDDRRRSSDLKRVRRLSELGRVTEADEGEETVKRKPPPLQPVKQIQMGKGRWPEDFIDVFGTPMSSPSTPIDVPKPTKEEVQLSAGDSVSPSSSSLLLPPIGTPSPSPRRPLRVRQTSVERQRERGSTTDSPTNGHIRNESILGSSPSGLRTTTASNLPLSSSPPRIRPIPRPRGESAGHLPRMSISPPPSPALLPKVSGVGSNASPGKPAIRRHSTQATRSRSVSPLGGGLLNGSALEIDTPPIASSSKVMLEQSVPFPRRVSGEHPRSMAPTGGLPSSTGLGHLSTIPFLPSTERGAVVVENWSQETLQARPPLSRGRFQSEVTVTSASSRMKPRPNSFDEKGRSRTESLGNIGADEGVGSILRERTNRNGSGIRLTLTVKEDGKAATHYQLGNCIGRGQFGSVYRALNLNTGQTVAVKRIALTGLSDPEITQLMNEVDLLKRLSHPSIVKYEGMARDRDTLSIVLEYVENGSLLHTLKAFGRLNERLVAGYVIKILEGLYYLHQSQVVHCDLKAANILTTKNGNVKLSDFGVSLNLRAMENIKSDVAGTPNWMAPEVIELKGASTASDIWSLGCTIVELLTGKPPYSDINNGMTVLFRIVDDEHPPLPDICSDALKDFLIQCFQKDPAKRPSAEVLFEHDWLKRAWGLHNDLRPQDSIPFLKRVSAELTRVDVSRRLSVQELSQSESPFTESFSNNVDEGFKAPAAKRSSAPLDRESSAINGFRQHHSFVKTSFSKAVVCRVCQLAVKSRAVLCQDCSLIAHSRCAQDAPDTCDIRTQLLLYAQYGQETPAGPSTPILSAPPEPPPKHNDSPANQSPTGVARKIFARKKSNPNTSESFDASARASSPSPVEQRGKRGIFFGRARHSDDWSRSRASLNSSTPNSSSLRSTGDKSTAAPIANDPAQLASSATVNSGVPGMRLAQASSVSGKDVMARPAKVPSTRYESEAMSSRSRASMNIDDDKQPRPRRRLSKSDSQTSRSGCLVQ